MKHGNYKSVEVNCPTCKKYFLSQGNRQRVEDRTQDTIWEFPKPKKAEGHPTMKPIQLCERAIKNSSKVGWLIIDTFLGSGSTMVAAHQLNRKCYGMELDPKYCQVIVDRMLKLDPSLEIKRNGKVYKKKDNNSEVTANA